MPLRTGLPRELVFQSTHPSGVRLDSGVTIWGKPEISIHAPQWGATPVPGSRRLLIGISIHAPQWGATRPYAAQDPLRGDFNPRTPVGCDSRRATSWCSSVYFNPRTPVGCDLPALPGCGLFHVFQSTHPSGVRPRTEGPRVRRQPISIHAPQWGATRTAHTLAPMLRFQSTHPSGVRRYHRHAVRRVRQISIHAPQWGATQTNWANENRTAFQSTHPSGVRRGL